MIYSIRMCIAGVTLTYCMYLPTNPQFPINPSAHAVSKALLSPTYPHTCLSTYSTYYTTHPSTIHLYLST